MIKSYHPGVAQQLRKNKQFRVQIIILLFIITLVPGCQRSGQEEIQLFPTAGQQISVFGWVGASFSGPMEKSSVETAFSITPETDGQIFWQGDTLWFRPIQPFDAGVVYRARFSGEVRTADGKTFTIDHTWDFTARKPDLIYFVPNEEGGELWRFSLNENNAYQMSFTEGRVYDFAVDRMDGQVVFTVMNADGGRNLRVMERDGEEQRLFLDCNRDLCGEPAWSTDGQTIAYTREMYLEDNGSYQLGQVWTVDLESGQTSQLYQSEFAFGHSPSFSPDGQRLAFYDSNNYGIRILDLATSQESIIPRTIPGAGDWSPDGSKIIYTDLVPAENEPFVAVYVVDLETKVVERVLSEGGSDTDYSQPRWAPDGERVAVSLRPVNANISKELWVLRLDGLVSRKITNDRTATFTTYQWDPWGERLVYQRYELGTGETSIWLWEDGENKQIVENGARPQWLP